jgi:hypothetical protein
MTSFLAIPYGQNATNSGKHCQAGFAYCLFSRVFPQLLGLGSGNCNSVPSEGSHALAGVSAVGKGTLSVAILFTALSIGAKRHCLIFIEKRYQGGLIEL